LHSEKDRLAFLQIVSYIDTMGLTRKHRRTLDHIFEEPTRSDVPWSELEGLFRALGAELSEGRGSRVRVHLHGIRAVFHRPHPRPETDRGALKSVRRFLIEAGIGKDD
jgi:hypothetical protein